jgi:acetyl esterase/lipase
MRLAALVVLALIQQGPKPPDEVAFEKDVVYGKGAGEDLKLNLSRPKGQAGAAPCVLLIHGGGWAAGSKEGHNAQTWDLVRRGYVSATVGYRFAPRHPFPAQVEDVKCAVRFLRANAEKYGIDPARIGAVGFSAGAHLSMMLGVMGKEDGLEGEGGFPDQPSQVNAVVSYFGPTDFVTADYPEASRAIVAKFLGGSREEKAEAYRRASPVTYVTKGDAPTLVIQGTRDPLVPHTQAIVMGDALTAAGVPGRVELVLGAGHNFPGEEGRRLWEATCAWFDQHLKPKKKP